jgi:hypothetical protein
LRQDSGWADYNIDPAGIIGLGDGNRYLYGVDLVTTPVAGG